MQEPGWLEAGGASGERIYPRQNKRDRSLLTTLQGSSEQDSKGDTGHKEAGWGVAFVKWGVRRYRNI